MNNEAGRLFFIVVMAFLMGAALIFLNGCSFYVAGADQSRLLAECHVGAFEPSFCVVNKTKDQAIVSGAGAIATFNTSGSVAGEGVAIGTLLAK